MTPIVAPMAAAIKLVCSCEPLILFAERAAAFDQEYSRWSFCKTVNLNDALPNVTILRPAAVYHVPIVDPFIARDGTTVDLARSLGVSSSRRCQSSGGKVRLTARPARARRRRPSWGLSRRHVLFFPRQRKRTVVVAHVRIPSKGRS